MNAVIGCRLKRITLPRSGTSGRMRRHITAEIQHVDCTAMPWRNRRPVRSRSHVGTPAQSASFCERKIAVDRLNVNQQKFFPELFDPGKLHLQSSYGVLNYPDLSMDYARFGIAMYGVLSSPDKQLLKRVPLRPVLSLRARISSIRDLKSGETVSYGRHFQAGTPMRAAAVTIGYADGLPRSLSGKNLPVLVRDRRTHVIGNICMDQLIIDVTGIPEARPGDIVTFLGSQGHQTLRAEEMAEKADTITNELLCRLHIREI